MRREMMMRMAGVLLLALASFAPLGAAEIEGVIVIKHVLTKRKATPAAGAYERGVAVELAADPAEQNPLTYERTHVVIYLDGQLPASGAAAAPVVMEQKNRRFVPDLVVIPAGAAVAFPNRDPIFHNVFSLSKPKSFDLGNYPKGQSRNVTFPKPGIVLVNCYLHTNMTGAIVVTPNQWNARSDAEGRFAIHNAPAGKRTLVAWHKAAGFFRQTVDLTETRVAHVEFLLPLDENGNLATQATAQR